MRIGVRDYIKGVGCLSLEEQSFQVQSDTLELALKPINLDSE